MSEDEAIEQAILEMLAYINRTTELVSLLYDMDLMPEQLQRGTKEWRQMMTLAAWHHQTISRRKNDGGGQP